MWAQGTRAATQSCLSSIAAGDGREVFQFESDGLLVHLPSKHCLVAAAGAVALQSCASAVRANDGRSFWSVSSTGEIQLAQTPDMCLSAGPGVGACSGLGDAGKWSLAAVPEHDPAAARVMQYGAAALTASVKRQQALMAELQGLLPKLASCKLTSSLAINQTRTASFVASASGIASKLAGVAAVADVYGAFGVDMLEVGHVITETAGVLATVKGK